MTALLLIWFEETGGPPQLTAVRIALRGRTELQIDTEPGANVKVEVGGVSFGPRRADNRGKALIPIEVPPGIRTAQVVAQSDKRITTRLVSLDIPPANPLIAAISPEVLFDGDIAWLIAMHSGASEGANLEAEVRGGHAERVLALPEGAMYRITPAPSARHLAATVRLRGRPEARATATAEISSQTRPRSIASVRNRRIATSAMLGGFYAGGANGGLALAIDGSYRLPHFGERLSLDLEIGFRSAGLSTPVPNLGRLDSTLSALLIELAARVSLLERGRWTVQGRLGGGVAPFWVSARSDFQAPFTQRGLAREGFAAAQLGYRLGELELLAELRASLAPAKSSAVDARLGGLLLAAGARYSLP
jgi:hypothetical protein